MTKKIDPVGRIEGHMGLEFDLNTAGPDGMIEDNANLKVIGTMYRGFENIMIDRQPQEGIQICQRI